MSRVAGYAQSNALPAPSSKWYFTMPMSAPLNVPPFSLMETLPLSPELISQLNDRVRANNERLGLSISLKVGDESALPGALKLFFAKGVRNYFVLAGSDRPGLDEDLGYASADLMLFAQDRKSTRLNSSH